jgi:hypothetical protein
VLYSAASWELVYALAPDDATGEYQGVYNAGLDLSMLVAPTLFAWLASGRHTPEWLVVAGLFVLCALLLRPVAGRGTPPGKSGGGEPADDAAAAGDMAGTAR